MPLFGGPEMLEAVRSSLAREQSLFFLRNKGGAEGEFYRLVVMDGVIVNLDGVAEAPAGEDGFLADLSGVAFDDIVAEVTPPQP